jgi:hypothetical protein
MGGYDENEIRTAFHVRLALNLLHGNSLTCCRKSLKMASNLSMDKTLAYIEQLDCTPEEKTQLKEMLD